MFFLWFLTVMGGAFAVYTLLNRISSMEHRFDRLLSRMDRMERDTLSPEPDQSPAARVSALAARLPVISSPIVEQPEPEPEEVAPPPVIAPVVVAPPPPPPAPATPSANRWAARVVRGDAAPVESEAPPAIEPAKPFVAAIAAATPPSSSPPPPAPPPPPSPPVAPQPAAQPARKGVSIEALIGGKLPIWVGGVALILSAFFLVRYSIEQGLLGPGVRSVMAAVFGVALLVASEAARRIPRFAEDPRVGQALAGAGIASLYGTLYMAGQLYGLISPTVAFVLMAAVTAGALFLSLRHGPPTAIMGLIGGFTAPFLAAPSGNLVPLLVYLGLLIAGLFAVAIQRGWMWLALAATGGGAVWTFGIMAADLAGIGPSLGLFIVVLALAATMLFPRTGGNDPRIRLIPMIVGFVQLALFAPLIQFDATGWALYGLLSAASLYLGWREPKLMPATLAALGLVVILLFAAFEQERPLALWAAIAATVLFALPGHLLARKDGKTQNIWTALALGGIAGPLLVGWISQGLMLFNDTVWGLFFTGAAAIAFSLSWRARDEGHDALKPDWALFGGGILAGLLAFIAITHLVPDLWMATAGFAIMLGLSGWARQVKDSSLFNASVPFGLVAGIFWAASYILRPGLTEAIFIDGGIPPVMELVALFVIPAILFAAAGWCHRGRISSELLRWVALILAAAVPLALVPSLWHISAMAGAAAVLGLWARQSSDAFRFRASLALITPASLFWANQMIVNSSLPLSIIGDGAPPTGLLITAVLVVPAILIAITSWFHKGQISRETLRTLTLALAVSVPLSLVPALWHAVVCFAAAAGLAAWLRKSDDGYFEGASGALLGVGLLYWLGEQTRHLDLWQSIFSSGNRPDAMSLLALLAGPAAIMFACAWGHKGRVTANPLRWAGLVLVVALVLAIVPYDWHGAAIALIAGGTSFASGRLPLPRYGLEALFGVAALWVLLRLTPFIGILFQSVAGVPTHFDLLEPIASVLIACGLPAVIFALMGWKMQDLLNGRVRIGIMALAGVSAIATLYALIKQPLQIATDAQFITWGFIERAIITQALAAIGLALLWRGGEKLRLASIAVLSLAAARLIGFDLLLFNPLLVDQNVGGLPFANAATIHFGLAAMACWWIGLRHVEMPPAKTVLRFFALGLVALTVAMTVRQAFQGSILTAFDLPNTENYGYSIAFLILSLVWLWRGIAGGARWLRMTGLALLTLVTLKVFLIDAAALEGLLRVLSFMGLGGALIGIGWVYTKVLTREAQEEEAQSGV